MRDLLCSVVPGGDSCRKLSTRVRRKVLDLLKAGRTVTQLANDLQISGQTIYV